MSRLTLVGASGLAREIVALLHSLVEEDREVVIVDDDPALVGTEVGGVPVTGGIDDLGKDGEVLVCVGSGPARRRIVGRLAERGVDRDRYATLVHPRTDVPVGCTVGRGSVLLSGVVLTADVTVGDHVVVMPNVILTHDDVVEDHATLCAGVVLGGGVRVGDGSYLGMASSVREDVVVGADAVLGMGAVLLSDLPAGSTWVGVPAHPVNHPVEEAV